MKTVVCSLFFALLIAMMTASPAPQYGYGGYGYGAIGGFRIGNGYGDYNGYGSYSSSYPSSYSSYGYNAYPYGGYSSGYYG